MAHAGRVIEVRLLRPDERDRATELLPLNRLDQPQGVYLVAWVGKEPVGHAHIDWRTEPPELQDVYVVDSFRRRGIASTLSRAAEAAVAARGGTCLSLTVSVSNLSARRLYEKLGYLPTADPPWRVRGTVQLRTGPLEVDDTLMRLEKPL
jgi:ribosomal protein S18 acetylase RimI-like enzyme